MNKEYKPITNLWKDSEGYRYFGTLKLSSKIKYDGDDFIPLWEWINQLQQENKKQKEVIDKAIKYYEANQQECVIGRNKDDKLIKEYYLPAQCSNELLDILKEVK